MDHEPEDRIASGPSPSDETTLEAAAKALRGTLSSQEAFQLLTGEPGDRRLSPQGRESLAEARTTEPLLTGQLAAVAEALMESSNEAAQRLARTNASREETESLSAKLRQEAASRIAGKSEFHRDYAAWLSHQDELAGPLEGQSGHQDSLRDIVNHRLHEIATDPATMPNRLDALHLDIINLEEGVIPPWYNPETMAIPDEESQNATNWLVPKLVTAMNFSQAAGYLEEQMASHAIGTTGDVTPETFAKAIIDPHVDPDLAAEWRTSPTTYHTPPRNPAPGEPWNNPESHSKATYAWILRDALNESWLPRHIWMGEHESLAQEAREKAGRLQNGAEFLTEMSQNAQHPAFKNAPPPHYQPSFAWDRDPQLNWHSALESTANGTEIENLWSETVKTERYINDNLLEAVNELDQDHPASLLLQEAVCNLQEIRLSVYKIALEQTIREETKNENDSLITDLAEAYISQGMPTEHIEETTRHHRESLQETPQEALATDRYIEHELTKTVARFTHIDFNLRAFHALTRS